MSDLPSTERLTTSPNALLRKEFVRVVGNSGSIRIIGLALAFVIGIVLARALGPAAYGVYGTAMALLAIAMIPTEFGVPTLVAREIAASAGQAQGAKAIVGWALKRILRATFFVAIVGAALIIHFRAVVEPALVRSLLIGIGMISAIAIGNVYGAALRGLHQVVRGQLGEIVLRPLVVIVLVATYLVAYPVARFSPEIAIAVNMLAAMAAAGLSSFWFLRAAGERSRTTTGTVARLSMRDAFALAMGDGIRILASQIAILMLAAMTTNVEVGQYRVAYQIYAVATMPSSLVNIALAPMIARLVNIQAYGELSRLNRWITMFLVCFSAAGFLFIMVFGEYLIAFLFGDAYLPAARILAFLLCTDILISALGHPIVLLNMARKPIICFWAGAVGGAVTLLVALVAIPKSGALGAAIASSFGLWVSVAICGVYAAKMLGIHASPVFLWFGKAASTN